jgi:hypothetical protein
VSDVCWANDVNVNKASAILLAPSDGRKIPVMLPSDLLNQRYPEPSIMFKFFKLERIYDVMQVAGYQWLRPL